MKNIKLLGMLAIALAFGASAVGCATPAPNFFDLGDVSQDNHALIQVLPAGGSNLGHYPFSNFANINGQGSHLQWPPSRDAFLGFGGSGSSVVRVAPGSHTFTMTFVFEGRNIPVSVTYAVQAGMGYTFDFSVLNIEGDAIAAEIIIREHALDDSGNFARGRGRIAYRHTETFHRAALMLR